MYETQIAAGIKYLEEERRVTDWRERLADVTLSMHNGSACILGHLFGDYYDHVTEHNLSYGWAVEHGFNLPDGVDFSEYGRLGQEWRATITGTVSVGV